tara:strand:- start:223 stop:375 length:153 start_codon:yes stop_codon:yes gene_type:complete
VFPVLGIASFLGISAGCGGGVDTLRMRLMSQMMVAEQALVKVIWPSNLIA